MCIVYPLNECRLNVFPHILLCQKRTLSCFTQDVSLVFSKKFFHYFKIFFKLNLLFKFCQDQMEITSTGSVN